MNELVSVVIPIYNMADSIAEAIQSLQKQSYKNIEIILIDDGSSDDSLAKCKQIAQGDKRITVIHTDNRGSGPARNTGISTAKGSYIYFPDADDFLEPTAIEKLLNTAKNTNCYLVVFGFRILNQKGVEIERKEYSNASFESEKLRMNYSECMNYTGKWGIQGAPWNKFFDLNIIKKHGVLYPPLKRHQDEGFIGRYMSFSNKVVFINDVLYTYKINDLKKEWEKYPKDYLDCVTGLYECRKDNILAWNEEDDATHQLVIISYVTGVIKSMEMCFSKKQCPNKKEIKQQIISIIQKSNIVNYDLDFSQGFKYQKVILSLSKKKRYSLLKSILGIKVFFEKNFYFIFSWLRKRN